MNYTGYLLADFGVGLDKSVQPWLSPDDAQLELFDGYVYRGVWQKREGYSQLATGQRGGTAYCESRMVHRISAASMTGAINSSNKTYTATLSTPVRRGSVTVNGTNPVQSATDNGLGVFNTGGNVGTVDYTTGALSITLASAPTAGSVTVTYDVHQGLPVMGVMNFFTQTNVRELIVADTTYVNRFNAATNRLDDISPSILLTGSKFNFCSWTNYPDPNGFQRLLFVNNKDPIQQYSGSTITPYPVYTASTQITAAASGVLGNGTVGPYVFSTPANTGIVPGTLTITATAQNVTDNQFGTLQGDGSGTVNYLTGEISVTFNGTVLAASAINITYKQLNTPIETCLHVFQFKDRLVILYPTETGGILRGLRIRVSGVGAMGDVFTTDAIGAGVIDIPDNTFISSADFNRDDLLIFTESTWTLKYTSNDVVPFALDKIDESRGSSAPYGTITYLNKTNAASPRGLVITDGYTVARTDDKIPDYSFNEIDSENFGLSFAGSVDEDRDHYLIHPSPGNGTSDRILVTNYEEENYAVYRLPLSSMGNFIGAFDVTWDDLLVYNNWDELAAVYGNWNAFAYSKGAPFAVGGGHQGQITKLNNVETEDYPVKIRNITVVDALTLQVTTDFQNYEIGDYITLEGIGGMLQANDKQAPISSITNNYTFNLFPIDTVGYSAYTGSGTASKVVVFSTKTKKFNPFADQDKKVRCGWVYFYVSTSGTDLTENKMILGATQADPCVLNIPGHSYSTGNQIFVNAVGGMVEINGTSYYITKINNDFISLNGVDSTGYTAYTSGGFSSIPVNAKLQVRVIVNDNEQSTQLNNFNPAPYEVNLTNLPTEVGIKKWYKIWVNQVGRFIQLEFGNNQSGTKIQIQGVMPGLAGIGRLI